MPYAVLNFLFKITYVFFVFCFIIKLLFRPVLRLTWRPSWLKPKVVFSVVNAKEICCPTKTEFTSSKHSDRDTQVAIFINFSIYSFVHSFCRLFVIHLFNFLSVFTRRCCSVLWKPRWAGGPGGWGGGHRPHGLQHGPRGGGEDQAVPPGENKI